MAKIRLTKQYTFETAHALHNYDGLCKNLHGHSYILYVTIIGEPIEDSTNPKLGMVMDFGDLKRIVNENIVDRLDHAVILNKTSPEIDKQKYGEMFQRFEIVDYQPTCENMIIDFAERIKNNLPANVQLFSLKLHETATSFAEWFASDNE